MTILELAEFLGGSSDKGLKLLFGWLGEVREKFPDADGQIGALVDKIAGATANQFDREHLIALATQLVDLVSGKGWGPPNPGAVAGM